MDSRLKNRYPFRLGTTSFIYPADYVANVRRLAPFVDEIELLVFESDALPTRSEIKALAVLAQSHGITYNVHLPIDVDLTNPGLESRRCAITSMAKALDRVAPLSPTTHTLHIPCPMAKNREGLTDGAIQAWQSLATENLTRLLHTTGIEAGRISIETLDYPPAWLTPIVDTFDLSMCIDVGHIILHGFDLGKVLDSFAARTTILHLHGVSEGKDHLAVNHLELDDRNILSDYLLDFGGSVSIEVFNLQYLTDSLAYFPNLAKISPGEIKATDKPIVA